ncbi:MAG: hypothetical protein IPO92_17560 [Saprospiraceae bacterium]|nr:hypothetical protein [Saprospiraceae bacterium]
MYDLQDHAKIQWFITESQSTSAAFIKSHTNNLKSCSLLIVITLPSHSLFFSSYKFQAKSWLVIHNYNTHFNKEISYKFRDSFWDTIKQYIKILKYRLEYKHEQIISSYKNYDNIVFPSAFVLNNPQNKDHLQYFPKPILFDFAIHEKEIFRKKNDRIKIVIPGTPSQNTKDIQTLWEAFKYIIPTLKKPVELIFLGQLKSRKNITYISRFKKFENEFFCIRYFLSFLPQIEFDAHMMHADFLILPLKRSMLHGIFIEYFGQTTVSGSISDMIKYGIPSLLPDFYPLEKNIEPLVKRYSNETSLSVGIIYTIEADLNLIKNNAMLGLVEYSTTKMSQKLLTQNNF